MDKKTSKRKSLRRKYKHLAAALAGVAIIAGTTLGIPATQVEAAQSPTITPPIAEQITMINKNVKKPIVETNTNVVDPLATPDGSDKEDKKAVATPDPGDKNKNDKHDNRDRGDRDHRGDRYDHNRYDHNRYDHERWADLRQSFNQRMAWYNDSLNKIEIYKVDASPVDIVKAAAEGLGFDVNNDTFSLISQLGSQSIVRVFHNGNNYDITVNHLSNGNWQVSLLQQVI